MCPSVSSASQASFLLKLVQCFDSAFSNSACYVQRKELCELVRIAELPQVRKVCCL